MYHSALQMLKAAFIARFVSAVAFCLCITRVVAIAQPNTVKLPKMQFNRPGEYDTVGYKMATELAKETSGLLDKEINPAEYYVGPGDVFHLFTDIPGTRIEDVQMSPDGKLMVQGIGAISVRGMTLAQAEQAVTAAIRRVFKANAVSLTLKKVRSFKATVVGAVRKPGVIPASATDRVSEIVDRAGGMMFNASLRHIIIRRDSLPPVTVDLMRYLSGELAFNPTLRGGDVVYVPVASEKGNIEVAGEVGEPGKFEFRQGDSLFTLLRFAQGLLVSSFLDSVEIVRFTGHGNEIKHLYISLPSANIDSIASANNANIPLEIGDRIYVRAKPNWLKQRTVAVTGEVRYPGRYAIYQDSTKLSEIIQRAGGMLETASLENIQMVRRRDMYEGDRELSRLYNTPLTEMTESELRYFKARSRENPGIMSVDFRKLIEKNDLQNDIVVADQDSISVPVKKNYINVLGKVVNPGRILYHPGYTYLDYITLAGGFGYRSDPDETLIIKPRGEQALAENTKLSIESGDNILVPEQSEVKFIDIFTRALTIATQLITIAGIIYTIVRK